MDLVHVKRQSNHVANIFGRNGGYARSDKTPATSSRHEGKSVPRPARAENTMSLSSHRYVNNSEPPVFEFFLAKRTQKCGSQLQENFACTVMQRLCSIHTKYIKKSRRNKFKIKYIIAEAVIGGLFQRCSALKLSNSLQLLLRKLMSSQMSHKNLKVDQI